LMNSCLCLGNSSFCFRLCTCVVPLSKVLLF
jgi:hypothetical protein